MPSSIFIDTSYLDFHTHSMRHASDEDVMEIVSIHLGKERERLYYTIGLHPWWAEHPIDASQQEALFNALNSPNCLAMGEMGLDNLKGPSMTTQMDILRSQLTLAEATGKPVIIHCVRAFDQLIKIKKDFPGIKKWCIHGYGRHAILGKQLIDQGFYLSIMPSVKPQRYGELFQALPNNRLFLETDSMPEVHIKQVYLQVSEVTGIDLSELIRLMNSNAKDFFNK